MFGYYSYSHRPRLVLNDTSMYNSNYILCIQIGNHLHYGIDKIIYSYEIIVINMTNRTDHPLSEPRAR